MQEKLGLAFKVGVYPGRGPKEAAAGAGDPMELGKGMRLPPPPGGRAANKTKATAPAPAGRDGQQNRGGMPPRQNEKRTDRTAARLSEIKRYSVRPPGGGRDGQQSRGGMPPRQNENEPNQTAAHLSEIKPISGYITRLSRHSIRLRG